MILKDLTHDRGESDCWNYYDGIESAHVFFDQESKCPCVGMTFPNVDGEIVLSITEHAYLMNDNGKTIDSIPGYSEIKALQDEGVETVPPMPKV